MHCVVRGTRLLLLFGVLAFALVQPAAAQSLEELFSGQPRRNDPLAAAYLAAPYVGVLKGLSKTFRVGGKSPGGSLFAKLVDRNTQPWEGELIELFKGRPEPPERLSFEGGTLGLGGPTPLSLRLYAFVSENRPARISKLQVLDSDAWLVKSDEFSILSDTSFQLEALPLVDGKPANFREVIACVNKRSRPPACDGSSGAVIEDPLSGQPSLLMVARGGPPEWLKSVPTEICVEGQQGHVIRVPGSVQPIPLDEPVGDRWCSPTDLALNYIALREEGLRIGSLEGKRQLDSRFAPDNNWRMWAERPKAIKIAAKDVWVQRIVLHPPVAEALPSPQSSPSSFELVLTGQEPYAGRITKLWYGPILSRTTGEPKCESERLVMGKERWGQDDLVLAQAVKFASASDRRLKVTEPDKSRVNLKEPLAIIARVGSAGLYCGVARAVSGGDRVFEVALAINEEKTVSVQEKQSSPLAPPPVPVAPKAVFPPGAPVSIFFRSRDAVAEHKLQHAKVQNEDGAFADVDRRQLRFILPEESGFTVTKCEAKKVDCRHDGPSIELLPKPGIAIPSPVVVTLEFAPLKRIDLTIQREGPALLSVQQVSKGKAIDLIDPQREKGSVVTRSVQWSPGDKLRVRAVDDEFQEVSEIKVDGKAWGKQDEISLTWDAKAVAIVVKTSDRLFKVPLTVATSPKAGIDIKLETLSEQPKVGLPVDAQSKPLTIEGLKPGHALTVEPQESHRLEVATITLRSGKSPRTVDGPKLRLERSDFQGGKIALNLDVTLREAAFNVPDRFRLQPVVQIGKRAVLMKSCKVEIEDFLTGSKFLHKGGGYTEVTLAQDKRASKARTYAVKIQGGTPLCNGLEAVGPLQAAKLNSLQPDGTFSIPLKRSGSRAFVGVVSLPRLVRSNGHWRVALEALGAAFDAGAKEGRYLWGGIYGPDGKVLVKSETADYAPLDIAEILKDAGTMERLMDGKGLVPFETLASLIAGDVADFEGSVDMLIAGEPTTSSCGRFDSPLAQGSRTVLVRFAEFSGRQGTEVRRGVRSCEASAKGDKSGLVAEMEVVPGDWSLRDEPDKQLKRVISEAAERLHKP